VTDRAGAEEKAVTGDWPADMMTSHFTEGKDSDDSRPRQDQMVGDDASGTCENVAGVGRGRKMGGRKTADEQTREEWGGILSQAVRSRRKRKFFGVDVISGKEIADFPENIRPVSQQMKSVRR